MHNLIKRVAIIIILFLLVMLGLVYLQTSSQECLGISEKESKKMIHDIFEKKLNKDKYARILGSRITDLTEGSFHKYEEKNDFLSYVEIIYVNERNEQLGLKVAIFETCEIQWILN